MDGIPLFKSYMLKDLIEKEPELGNYATELITPNTIADCAEICNRVLAKENYTLVQFIFPNFGGTIILARFNYDLLNFNMGRSLD